jgi:hypothetical protein
MKQGGLSMKPAKSGSDFEFDDASSGAAGEASDVAGKPEGDGDFESDLLPETNQTSAGGPVEAQGDTRDEVEGRGEKPGELSGLMKVIDEISTGKLQP